MYDHNFHYFSDIAYYYETRRIKENGASWVYFLSIDNETKIGCTGQNPVERWKQLGSFRGYLSEIKFAAYNCEKWGLNCGEFERAIHNKLREYKKYPFNTRCGGYLGPISLRQGYTEIFNVPIEDATKAAYELLESYNLTGPKQYEFSF